MKKQEAVELLSQALDQAFKKGVYSLQDAGYIVQALTVLIQETTEPVIEKKETN